MKKVISALILAVIFISIININVSYAAIQPGSYKPSGVTEDTTAINIANKIIGGFQAIGSIVSVVALIAIGIKYMMGSIEEKAEYKQTMMNYVIGAILVFAISNISAMLYRFAQKIL